MKFGEVERHLISVINAIRNCINAYGNLIVALIIVFLLFGATLFLLRRAWPQAVTLPLLAIAISFWFWAENRASVAALLQAFAAIILIGVTLRFF